MFLILDVGLFFQCRI